MTLHFSAKQIFGDENVRLNWCKMTFKPDFMRLLKTYNTIPKQRIKTVLKMMQSQKEDELAILMQHSKMLESQKIIEEQKNDIEMKDEIIKSMTNHLSIELSDDTSISGTTWGELKQKAMEPGYMQKSTFVRYLTKLEKDTLKLLIMA